MFVPMGKHVASLFTTNDLEIAASKLRKNTAAVLFLWENLWTDNLRKALTDSGGKLVERAQIPADVVKEFNKRLAAEERKAAAAKKRKAEAAKKRKAAAREEVALEIQSNNSQEEITCQVEEDQVDQVVSVGPAGQVVWRTWWTGRRRWTRWPRTTRRSWLTRGGSRGRYHGRCSGWRQVASGTGCARRRLRRPHRVASTAIRCARNSPRSAMISGSKMARASGSTKWTARRCACAIR